MHPLHVPFRVPLHVPLQTPLQTILHLLLHVPTFDLACNYAQSLNVLLHCHAVCKHTYILHVGIHAWSVFVQHLESKLSCMVFGI